MRCSQYARAGIGRLPEPELRRRDGALPGLRARAEGGVSRAQYRHRAGDDRRLQDHRLCVAPGPSRRRVGAVRDVYYPSSSTAVYRLAEVYRARDLGYGVRLPEYVYDMQGWPRPTGDDAPESLDALPDKLKPQALEEPEENWPRTFRL